MNLFNRLALTISYVTSIPVPCHFDNQGEETFSGLSKFLPFVGMLISALLVLASYALNFFHTNALLASTIIICLWLSITGGLHMDGLMDTADGIFSHRSKERMLEIMQDSRVGNFAVLVSTVVILVKIAALQTLSPGQALIAVALVPGWARACEVYAIGRFEYARLSGKGKIWHDSTRMPADLILATIPIMLLTAVLAVFSTKLALLVTAGTILAGVFTAHFLNKKISGHTGDTYGAVVELAEVAGILCATLSL